MPVSMFLLVHAASLVAASPDMVPDDRRWTGGYAGIGIGLDLPREARGARIDLDTDLDGAFGDPLPLAARVDALAPALCGGRGLPARPAGCRRERTGYDGHVGYDLRFGDVVVGAIGEVGRSGVVDSAAGTGGAPAPIAIVRTLDWSARGRLRAGYALGDTLPYLTGGATMARIDHGVVTDDAAARVTPERDRRSGWGYLVGGGVEQRVSDAVSLGLLYTYTNVRDAGARARIDGGFFAPFASGTAVRQGAGRFDWHSARVRASFRF